MIRKIIIINYNQIIYEPIILPSPSPSIYLPIHHDSIFYKQNRCCWEWQRSRMNPCLWLFRRYSALFRSIRGLSLVCLVFYTPNQCCWEWQRSRMNPCLWLFRRYSALFWIIWGPLQFYYFYKMIFLYCKVSWLFKWFPQNFHL
jgi:hypothetical protein